MAACVLTLARKLGMERRGFDDRGLEQRMAREHTGIDQANDWGVGVGWIWTCEQLGVLELEELGSLEQGGGNQVDRGNLVELGQPRDNGGVTHEAPKGDPGGTIDIFVKQFAAEGTSARSAASSIHSSRVS